MKNLVNVIRRHLVAQAFRKKCSRMAHKWGYAKSELPPSEWHKEYPIAGEGTHQSPINLVSACATVANFRPFEFSYQTGNIKSVCNNGHSVTFQVNDGNSVMCGGPLKDQFQLEQFHFHWGCDSSQGSEHLVDGKPYAAELHFVHWNSDKYKSFNESLSYPDGLCVLGTFLEAGEHNQAYEKVVDNIRSAPLKGDKKDINHEIDPRLLLPEDVGDYFFYPGSLTTPPLKECVQWVVFKQPVRLSESQLTEFRSLRLGSEKSDCLFDNFRPVQPLGKRLIFSSR